MPLESTGVSPNKGNCLPQQQRMENVSDHVSNWGPLLEEVNSAILLTLFQLILCAEINLGVFN